MMACVRQMGNAWNNMAVQAYWLALGRTAESLRCRWKRMASGGCARGYGAPTLATDATAVAEQAARMEIVQAWRWGCDGATRLEEAEKVVAGREGMPVGKQAAECMGDLCLDGSDNQKHRNGHWGWAQAVNRLGRGNGTALAGARVLLTPLHARLVLNWRLHETASGRGMLVCDFKAATKKMRRIWRKQLPGISKVELDDMLWSTCLTVEERDAHRLVAYSGQRRKLGTILASGTATAWLGGPQAPHGGCYLSGTLKSAWMGMNVQQGAAKRARQMLGEAGLASLVGDSVYLPFAEALIQFASSVARTDANTYHCTVVGWTHSPGPCGERGVQWTWSSLQS